MTCVKDVQSATDVTLFLTSPTMSPENSRRGELAQPVADHILGDENFDVRLAVVHEERVSDKLGDDCARPRPRFNGLLFPRLVELLNLCENVGIDKRTFFE